MLDTKDLPYGRAMMMMMTRWQVTTAFDMLFAAGNRPMIITEFTGRSGQRVLTTIGTLQVLKGSHPPFRWRLSNSQSKGIYNYSIRMKWR